MESFTKVKLNDSELSSAVQAAFGKEAVIVSAIELTGGFFNTAYDLELEDGRQLILKVAPSDRTVTLSYEKNIMAAEVEALRLVAADGRIPVPAVYSYDDSRSIIQSPYFFMEKISGQPYNEVKEGYSPVEQAEIERELGRYQRLINGITGPRFGLFVQEESQAGVSWRESFTRMFRTLLEDARELGVVLPAGEEVIWQLLEHYLPALDEVTEPRLVHWDLWNGNLFVQNGQIISIIDWERALWGDVLMEYYFRHFEQSEPFHEGYGQHFGSPGERLRIKLYDFYLDLIMRIECDSRQYIDGNHIRWAEENLNGSWKSFSSLDSGS
ncbi:phosphotransferase family protein [Paenibacillus camerounensis]|uniref:phosphotransferase family protein n=1 Tax=Paenibacillus camerounensis TaxID=1243663 RepID=UPI00069496E5|nr:aminoglycoside phosphotransferase family protein [Paenibacillus camerounensis]